MNVILFIVWAALSTQVAGVNLFIPQQQCQSLRVTQFHHLLQEFVVEMPTSMIGDKNTFVSYIDEKFHDYSNYVEFSTSSNRVDASSSHAASRELQELVDEYLSQSSAALQKIAILSNIEPQATIPIGIKELLEYEGLYTTEAALIGYIELYERRPSSTLLSAISELHIMHPNVAVPLNIMNDLQLWGLLPSGDIGGLSPKKSSLNDPSDKRSVEPSSSNPSPASPEPNPLFENISDYEIYLKILWNNYTAYESESILKEISNLISTHPELKVPLAILQELKDKKILSNPNSLVIILIHEYNESPTISKLQEIREVLTLYPQVQIPKYIFQKIEELPSYYQIILNELIHDYQVTASHDVLLKIAEIIFNYPELTIPAYIVELINEMNEPTFTFQEKLLHTLISKYEKNRSDAILQEIAAIAQDNPSLVLPAFIVIELAKTSQISPSQYYFQDILKEYYITKSPEVLQEIIQLIEFDTNLMAPAAIGEVMKVYNLQKQDGNRELIPNGPGSSRNPAQRSPYPLSQGSPSPRNTDPSPQTRNPDDSNDLLVLQLIQEYEKTQSMSIIYRIIHIARSDPFVYLPPSIAFIVFSSIGQSEGSVSLYFQELITIYFITRSERVLLRLEELCNFDTSLIMPMDVQNDLDAYHQTHGPLSAVNLDQSKPSLTRSSLTPQDPSMEPDPRSTYPLLQNQTSPEKNEDTSQRTEPRSSEPASEGSPPPISSDPSSVNPTLNNENGPINNELEVLQLIQEYEKTQSMSIIYRIIHIARSNPFVYLQPSIAFIVFSNISQTQESLSLYFQELISIYFLTSSERVLLRLEELSNFDTSLIMPIDVRNDLDAYHKTHGPQPPANPDQRNVSPISQSKSSPSSTRSAADDPSKEPDPRNTYPSTENQPSPEKNQAQAERPEPRSTVPASQGSPSLRSSDPSSPILINENEPSSNELEVLRLIQEYEMTQALPVIYRIIHIARSDPFVYVQPSIAFIVFTSIRQSEGSLNSYFQELITIYFSTRSEIVLLRLEELCNFDNSLIMPIDVQNDLDAYHKTHGHQPPANPDQRDFAPTSQSQPSPSSSSPAADDPSKAPYPRNTYPSSQNQPSEKNQAPSERPEPRSTVPASQGISPPSSSDPSLQNQFLNNNSGPNNNELEVLQLIQEYETTQSMPILYRIIHIARSDPFVYVQPSIAFIVFTSVRQSEGSLNSYFQELITIYYATRSEVVLLRLEELCNFDSSLVIPIDVENDLEEYHRTHGPQSSLNPDERNVTPASQRNPLLASRSAPYDSFKEPDPRKSYPSSQNQPFPKENLAPSERDEPRSSVPNSQGSSSARSNDPNSNNKIDSSWNEEEVLKLTKEFETTHSMAVLYRIIDIVRSNPYVYLQPSIAYTVFSSMSLTEGSLNSYFQELISEYYLTKSEAVLLTLQQLCNFDISLVMPSDIESDLVSLSLNLQLDPYGLKNEKHLPSQGGLLSRSGPALQNINSLVQPDQRRSQPSHHDDLPARIIEPGSHSHNEHKQKLMEDLFLHYQKSDSDAILAEMLEIWRSDPSVNLPTGFAAQYLINSNGKSSEIQSYVDTLVARYMISNSDEILVEILIILNSHPDIYLPSPMSLAMVKHSKSLSAAELQLEVLTEKYHSSLNRTILFVISDILRANPSLPIPASIALDVVEILRGKSNVYSSESVLRSLISEYELSESVDILLKIQKLVNEDSSLVIPTHISHALSILMAQQQPRSEQAGKPLPRSGQSPNNSARYPAVASAILLQKLIAEYSKSQTLENLVKIVKFTDLHPGLRIPSFIAKKKARIAHLSKEELKIMILFEKFMSQPSPRLLSEIADLSVIVPHVPIPDPIAKLLQNEQRSPAASFLSDQILLEGYIQQYYLRPSAVLLNKIADLISIKPHLPVPPYIARLLAQREEWLSYPELTMQRLIEEYLHAPSKMLLADITELALSHPGVLLLPHTSEGADDEHPRSALPQPSTLKKRNLDTLVKEYSAEPSDALLLLIIELFKIYTNYPIPESIIFGKLIRDYMSTHNKDSLQYIVSLIPSNRNIHVPESVISDALEMQYLPSPYFTDYDLLRYLTDNYASTTSLPILRGIYVLTQSIEDQKVIVSIYNDLFPLVNEVEFGTPGSQVSATQSQNPAEPREEGSSYPSSTDLRQPLSSNDVLVSKLMQEYELTQWEPLLKRVIDIARSDPFVYLQPSMAFILFSILSQSEGSLSLYFQELLKIYYATKSVAVLRRIEELFNFDTSFAMPSDVEADLSLLRENQDKQNLEDLASDIQLLRHSQPHTTDHLKHQNQRSSYPFQGSPPFPRDSYPLSSSVVTGYVNHTDNMESIIHSLVQNYELTQSKELLHEIIAIARSDPFVDLPPLIAFIMFSSLNQSEGFTNQYFQELITIYYSTRSVAVLLRIEQLCNFDHSLVMPRDLIGDLINFYKKKRPYKLKKYKDEPTSNDPLLRSRSSMTPKEGSNEPYSRDEDLASAIEPLSAPRTQNLNIFANEFASVLRIALPNQQSSLSKQIQTSREAIFNFNNFVNNMTSEHFQLIDKFPNSTDDDDLVFLKSNINFASFNDRSSNSSLVELVQLLNNVLAIVNSIAFEAENLWQTNERFVKYADSEDYFIGLVETKAFVMNNVIAETALGRCAGALEAVVVAAKQGKLNIVALNAVLVSLLDTYIAFPAITYEMNEFFLPISTATADSRKHLLAVIMPTHQNVLEMHVRNQQRRIDILKSLMNSTSLFEQGSVSEYLNLIQQWFYVAISLTREAESCSVQSRKILTIAQTSSFAISDVELDVFMENINLASICLGKATGAMAVLVNDHFQNEISSASIQIFISELFQSVKDQNIIESIYESLFSSVDVSDDSNSNIDNLEVNAQNYMVFRYIGSAENVKGTAMDSKLLEIILPCHQEILNKQIEINKDRVAHFHRLIYNIVDSTYQSFSKDSPALDRDSSIMNTAALLKGIQAIVNQLSTSAEKIQQSNQEFLNHAASLNFAVPYSEVKPFVDRINLAELALGRCTGAAKSITEAAQLGLLNIATLRSVLDTLLDVNIAFPTTDYEFSTFVSDWKETDLTARSTVLSIVLPSRQHVLENYVTIQTERLKNLELFLNTSANNVPSIVTLCLNRLLTLVSSLTQEVTRLSAENRKIVDMSTAQGYIINDMELSTFLENINLASIYLGKSTGAISALIDACFSTELSSDYLSAIFFELMQSIEDQSIIEGFYDDLFKRSGGSENHADEMASVFRIILPHRQYALNEQAVYNNRKVDELRQLLNAMTLSYSRNFPTHISLNNSSVVFNSSGSHHGLFAEYGHTPLSSLSDKGTVLQGILSIVDQLTSSIEKIRKTNQEFVNYAESKQFYVSHTDTKLFFRNLDIAELALGRCTGATKSIISAIESGMLNIAALRAVVDDLLEVSIALPSIDYDFGDVALLVHLNGSDAQKNVLSVIMPPRQTILEKKVGIQAERLNTLSLFVNEVMAQSMEETMPKQMKLVRELERVLFFMSSLTQVAERLSSENRKIFNRAKASGFYLEQSEFTAFFDNMHLAESCLGKAHGALSMLIELLFGNNLSSDSLNIIFNQLLHAVDDERLIQSIYDDHVMTSITSGNYIANVNLSDNFDGIFMEGQTINSDNFLPMDQAIVATEKASLLKIILPYQHDTLNKYANINKRKIAKLEHLVNVLIGSNFQSTQTIFTSAAETFRDDSSVGDIALIANYHPTTNSSFLEMSTLLRVVLSVAARLTAEAENLQLANQEFLSYATSRDFNVTTIEIKPFLKNLNLAIGVLGQCAGTVKAITDAADHGMLNVSVLKLVLDSLLETSIGFPAIDFDFSSVILADSTDFEARQYLLSIILPSRLSILGKYMLINKERVEKLNLLLPRVIVGLKSPAGSVNEALLVLLERIHAFMSVLTENVYNYFINNQEILSRAIHSGFSIPDKELEIYIDNTALAFAELGVLAGNTVALNRLYASSDFTVTDIMEVVSAFKDSLDNSILETMYDHVFSIFDINETLNDESKDSNLKINVDLAKILKIILPFRQNCLENHLLNAQKRVNHLKNRMIMVTADLDSDSLESVKSIVALFNYLVEIIDLFTIEVSKLVTKNANFIDFAIINNFLVPNSNVTSYMENTKVASRELSKSAGATEALTAAINSTLLSSGIISSFLRTVAELFSLSDVIGVLYDGLNDLTRKDLTAGNQIIAEILLYRQEVLEKHVDINNARVYLLKLLIESISPQLLESGLPAESEVSLLLERVLSLIYVLSEEASTRAAASRKIILWAASKGFQLSDEELFIIQENMYVSALALGRSSGATESLIVAYNSDKFSYSSINGILIYLVEFSRNTYDIDILFDKIFSLIIVNNERNFDDTEPSAWHATFALDFSSFSNVSHISFGYDLPTLLALILPTRQAVLEKHNMLTNEKFIEVSRMVEKTILAASDTEFSSLNELTSLVQGVISVITYYTKEADFRTKANRASIDYLDSQNYDITKDKLVHFLENMRVAIKALGRVEGAIEALAMVSNDGFLNVSILRDILVDLLEVNSTQVMIGGLYDNLQPLLSLDQNKRRELLALILHEVQTTANSLYLRQQESLQKLLAVFEVLPIHVIGAKPLVDLAQTMQTIRDVVISLTYEAKSYLADSSKTCEDFINRGFDLTNNELNSYWSNVRQAALYASIAEGVTDALTLSARQNGITLVELREILNSLFLVKESTRSLEILYDLVTPAFNDESSKEYVLTVILPSRQEVLEKHVAIQVLRVETLRSFLTSLSLLWSHATGTTLHLKILLDSILTIVAALSNEAERCSLENKEILSRALTQGHTLSNNDLSLFLENTNVAAISLGRGGGAIQALVDTYVGNQLSISSLVVMLAELLKSIDDQRVIDSLDSRLLFLFDEIEQYSKEYIVDYPMQLSSLLSKILRNRQEDLSRQTDINSNRTFQLNSLVHSLVVGSGRSIVFGINSQDTKAGRSSRLDSSRDISSSMKNVSHVDNMVKTLMDILQIVNMLTERAEFWRDENQKFIIEAASRNFLITAAEAEQFFSNLRLASAALGRSTGASVAVLSAAEWGTLNIGSLKAIFENLLQIAVPSPIIDHGYDESASLALMNDSVARRSILSIIMPRQFSDLEKYVTINKQRVQSLNALIPNFPTIFHESDEKAFESLLILLESIYSLIITLTEHCDELLIDNRDILLCAVQDDYVVSGSDLETFMENTAAASTALGASCAGTIALLNLYSSGQFSIASLGNVATSLLETITNSEVLDSLYDMTFQNIKSKEEFDVMSTLVFSNETNHLVENEFAGILRTVLPAWQAILEKQVTIYKKYVNRVKELGRIWSDEANDSPAYSLAKFANILKSLMDLVDVLTSEALRLTEQNGLFINDAAKQNFKIPVSDVTLFMARMKGASTDLGVATGATKALFTSVQSGFLNMTFTVDVLRSLLEVFPSSADIEFLYDDVSILAQSEISSRQLVIANVLPTRQMVLEKQVSINNVLVLNFQSLIAFIINELSNVESNARLIELLRGTVSFIRNMTDEVNTRSVGNRNILDMLSDRKFQASDVVLLLFLENMRFSSVALGRIVAAISAMLNYYKAEDFSIRSGADVLSQLMPTIIVHSDVDDSFDLVLSLFNSTETSEFLFDNENVAHEVLKFKVALIEQKNSQATNRLANFELLVSCLFPRGETAGDGAVIEMKSALFGIISLVRYYTTHVSEVILDLKKQLDFSNDVSKDDFNSVAEYYKACFSEIGRAEAAIDAAIIAINTGEFNSGAIWNAIRKILQNDASAKVIELLFDDSSNLLYIEDNFMRRMVLYILLPKYLKALEMQVVDTEEKIKAVESIVTSIFEKARQSNTSISYTLSFEFGAIVTLMTTLVERAKNLTNFNNDLVTRAAAQGLDINDEDLEVFMKRQRAAAHLLAEVSGACLAVESHELPDFGPATTLRQLEVLLLEEDLLYKLKALIFEETNLRQLIAKYLSSRTFSDLKQIRQLMVVCNSVYIPEDVIQDMKRFGLYPGMNVTEEHILQQLIEEYLELPVPENFQRIKILLAQHPDTKIPIPLLEQFIIEKSVLKSESYLQELVLFYSNHLTPEVLVLIGQMIEFYPNYLLPLPIIKHLLQQGITTEVVLIQLILEFRRSGSLEVLELLSVVYYQFHPEYQLPGDILEAFFKHGIFVRTESYYIYLLQLPVSSEDSRAMKYIGELIDIFPNVQVPSYILQNLVSCGVITRTIFIKIIEAFKIEPSPDFLQAIANLHPLFEDVTLPDYIVDQISALRIVLISQTRESHLMQLVKSYQLNSSLDLLVEISDLSKMVPNAVLPVSIMEQISLYDAIVQANSTMISETILFPLILTLSPKYPQIPIPLRLQQQLSFYDLILKLEQTPSIEILLEVARLSPSFPNIPLPPLVQQQIYLLNLLENISREEVTIFSLQQIANLSIVFPIIPIPNKVQEMIRFLHLIENAVQSSTMSDANIREIKELSLRYASIPIPLRVQEALLLINLIDEVMYSESPSQLALQQIAVLSQSFPCWPLPVNIQEEIILIQAIERVLKGIDIDISIIKEIDELSKKYAFVILPDEVSQLILLFQLVGETNSSGTLSYSSLFQISYLSHMFPDFPVPADIKEQIALIQLIEELMGVDFAPSATLRRVSMLSATYPRITMPENVEHEVLLLKLLDEFQSQRNLELLPQICKLSNSQSNIGISLSILEQCRLINLIQEALEASMLTSAMLLEISVLSYSYSYIPVPDKIRQQILLVKAIEKASQQTAVSIGTLQEISDLSPLYPNIEIPLHVVDQISLMKLIQEAEQSSAISVSTLKEIHSLSKAYSGVPIPITIQNQIMFIDLLESYNSSSVTTQMIQQFDTLAESDSRIILPNSIQQAVRFVKLIGQAVETDSSDIVLLLQILELSQQFPSVVIPSAIALKIRLVQHCQTLENSLTYIPTAITEVIRLSSVYQHVPISGYVQNLIEFVQLIEKATQSPELSQQNLIQIQYWSTLYPFVPIPIILEQKMRFLTLIESLETHSNTSYEIFKEAQQLSELLPNYSLSLNVKEQMMLSQYINSKETSVDILRQIESLSQKYSFIAIPENIRQQLILIKHIEFVLQSSTISFEILQEIAILHEKYPNIPLPDTLLRELALVELCIEAMTSNLVSSSVLSDIEAISSRYPKIALPYVVQQQSLLIKLIRQVDFSLSPEVILLEISQLLPMASNVEIPFQIREQLFLIQLIKQNLESPSKDSVGQLMLLSTSYPSIELPESVQQEFHLQQLIDLFMTEMTPNEQLLQEIFKFHQSVPLYPIPDSVYQQMILQQLLLEVELLLAASETVSPQLLDNIDELSEIFPLYPVPSSVLGLLTSHREIKELTLYIELAQVTPTTEILQKIEELSRLHPNVHIPENINLLMLQHIQKMYFQQLVEEVMASNSPSRPILEEIELLSQTVTDVEIPPVVQAMIERHHQVCLFEQLIAEAQSSLAPSINLLERIFEISQTLRDVAIPPSLEQQMLLLRLIKNSSPTLEDLKKIKELSVAFPAITIPIVIQQQFFLLQLIQEAMMTASPSYAILEQISHSVEAFPNIILPERIQQQIADMKMTMRLEQLIKVIEQSSFPSPPVLKEISELSKVVKTVAIPPSIMLLIRLQELILEIQESEAPTDSLKEVARILSSIPNAPIPQSVRQQLILMQLIDDVQNSPDTAGIKLKQITQLSVSYPKIPIPVSVKLMIEKSTSPPDKRTPPLEPVNVVNTQLQQLVTMYDRIPSPLILRQIAQILPSAPDFLLPEKITQALVQLGLLPSESMPSRKLQTLIDEYMKAPSENTLGLITQMSSLVPNASLPPVIQRALFGLQINSTFSEFSVQGSSSLDILTASEAVDMNTISQRLVALSSLISLSHGYFDQAKNTLWTLRDSVRASGHPMHRTTLATFANVLNQISVMIAQAREISADMEQRFKEGDFSQISSNLRMAYELLGKSEGARVALLLEAKKFSHFIKLSSDKLLGTANNMKLDIDKVIYDLHYQTTDYKVGAIV